MNETETPKNRNYLILPLFEDRSEEELNFDLEILLKLSPEERYRMAIELSIKLIKMLEEHGYREPSTVLQRPLR